MTSLPVLSVRKLFPVIVAVTGSVHISGLNSASSRPSPSRLIGVGERRPMSVFFASIWKPEQMPRTSLPVSAIFRISRATWLFMVLDSMRLPPGIIIMSRASEAGLPFTRAFSRTRSVGRFPNSSKHGSAPGK